MQHTVRQLDAFVEPFEAARRSQEVDLAGFLPERGHPLYTAVLRELVRVDLEYGWEARRARPLDAYFTQFPELVQDNVSLQEIAYEEYRLRRAAGEPANPADYASRYGVNTSGWPGPEGAGPSSLQMEDAARSYRGLRLRGAEGGSAAVESGPPSRVAEGLPQELLRSLQRYDPRGADRFAEGLSSLPEVGQELLGFRLIAELGRGAFGRVFLAQQGALADRPVALKVAADVGGESQALAQLQHTHIVPIYSVHKTGCLQAVCMPYLGSVTLADVLQNIRGRTPLPQTGADLLRALRERKAAGQFPAVPAHLLSASYPEAVLWLGASLADGLAHAHERGILHRDLKPANVLLADDGTPLLLDFNLAEDVKQRDASGAMLGGTLPYMAPEHLSACLDGRSEVDERSDLYSLGIVLYELLTGRFPFASGRAPGTGNGTSSLPDLVERMIEERRTVPSVRQHNRAVTPALEAIVRRCLEPIPERRYRTARQLREDLQCQLEDRPLRHTREPSLRERGRKWLKRHPRFWLHLTSAAALALVAVAVGMGLRHRNAELAHAAAALEREQAQQAKAALKRFREDARLVQFVLSTQPDMTDAAKHHAHGVKLCQEALGRYQVEADPDWQRRPLVTALPPAERSALAAEVGELLLLLARAVAEPPGPGLKGKEKEDRLRQAMLLNERSEQCYPADEVPPVVWEQLVWLLREQGQTAEASALAREKDRAPVTARDSYLIGWSLMKQKRYKEAVGWLESAARDGPPHFWTWLMLGLCYEQLREDAQAIRCYTAASAVAPTFHGPFVNRGLLHYRRTELVAACADFDRAIALCPERPETYLDRALARHRLGQYPGSIADLTEALKRGIGATRVYFVRANVRRDAGDRAGADRDFAEGMKQRPTDPTSWESRAMARAHTDPKGALADVEEALALAPTSFSALNNKAFILAERLNRPKDALLVYDRMLELCPADVPARSLRAVYRARLGQREAALRDAEAGLARDPSPPTRYQTACAYALTSWQHPADADRALDLLREALERNYGLEWVAGTQEQRDSDLDNLRGLKEFKRLEAAAAAALELRRRPPAPEPKK
jgi:serine/threonine protein kinase/Tfp pilus assembly protein PilF